MLETGSKVKDFTIPTDRGYFTLSDYTGKNVVLFFFPRADTSGCTKEAASFTCLQCTHIELYFHPLIHIAVALLFE